MTVSGSRSPGVGAALVAVTAVVVLLTSGFGVFSDDSDDADDAGRVAGPRVSSPGGERAAGSALPEAPASDGPKDPAAPAASADDQAPPRDLFGRNRTLVAYYGTAGTGSLGVLGEARPGQTVERLTQAARAFKRPGRPVQVVFELIVTIADATPGPDGDFNHHLPRSAVASYIRAAHRHDALLLLDVQPGRASFPDVAKHWAWALRDPRVGLALDPEWRMARGEVPGQVIGSVDAAEVNEVSLWLANLTRREALPQKLFVLHQFRTSMIERIDRVAVRQRLATVQHVDGYGTAEQKLGTYRAVLQPKKFHPGFKLFYDEDVRLMRPADVLRIKPRVRFVSYQ